MLMLMYNTVHDCEGSGTGDKVQIKDFVYPDFSVHTLNVNAFDTKQCSSSGEHYKKGIPLTLAVDIFSLQLKRLLCTVLFNAS